MRGRLRVTKRMVKAVRNHLIWRCKKARRKKGGGSPLGEDKTVERGVCSRVDADQEGGVEVMLLRWNGGGKRNKKATTCKEQAIDEGRIAAILAAACRTLAEEITELQSPAPRILAFKMWSTFLQIYCS